MTVPCEDDPEQAAASGTDAASRSAKTTAFRTLVTEVGRPQTDTVCRRVSEVPDEGDEEYRDDPEEQDDR